MMHSIIIITRNRREEVRAVLAALASQTVPPDEVILVDAGSIPLQEKDIPAELPFASRLLHTDAGMAVQRNAGMDAAAGQILTFLDDDAYPEPEYCARIMRVFAEDRADEISAAGGVVTTPVSQTILERAFRNLFLLQTGTGKNRFRRSGFPDFQVSAASRTAPAILPSTALSFRRQAATDLRFDIELFSGAPLGCETGRCFGEDAWFTAMLSSRGRLVLVPDARFAHTASARNRESTAVTQALYVYAMRMLSDRFAVGAYGRLCRLWALTGQGLLTLLQSIRYRDAGYLGGYFRAMRVSLRRLPRTDRE